VSSTTKAISSRAWTLRARLGCEIHGGQRISFHSLLADFLNSQMDIELVNDCQASFGQPTACARLPVSHLTGLKLVRTVSADLEEGVAENVG
jgi:hypothetical protein